jgi:hypothetical protein
MSIVIETVLTYLPQKRKTTPSGWVSFNAPCCQHNGQSLDNRQRGGVIQEGEHISYHCFNCGFKASWQPGRNISFKLRSLLQWLHAPDDVINKLALQVMQENEGIHVQQKLVELPTFETVPLPDNAIKLTDITDFNKHNLAILEYMSTRNLHVDDTEYYWSPIQADSKYKYMSEQQPGYVFNLDEQRPQKIFVVVCEGPIDALHVDGVALLGSEIKDQQAMLINRLSKDVIVVPDRDEAGKKLIEQAIELGWGVSLPDWDIDINDVGDAVNKHGRLYALHRIVSAAETSPLKIRLKEKKWFN